MADAKAVRLRLVAKSAEHIDPLNLAFEQLKSLREWAGHSGGGLLDREQVLAAVAGFHPDRKYDQDTRELVHLAHLSGLWLLWERCDFDLKGAEFWTRLGIAKGHDEWANLSPVDHRKLALTVTAQLAIFEGDGLRRASQEKSLDAPDLWRRLYWFTRFYRAWQRIGAGFTPSQFASLEKKAQKARAWKRAAWAYFVAKITERPTLSVRTIAANFVKQPGTTVSAHEVQVYLGQRVKLAYNREPPSKESIG